MSDAPRVHAVAGRSGPPILLLHGFGSDRLSWLANQQELAAVGHVYALDLPGHGDTPLSGAGELDDLAASVAAALDEADLGPVHVVAHSLGGGVAVALAAREPNRVRSLALIAPAGLGGAPDTGFLEQFPRLSDPEKAEALLQRLVSRPRLINRQMVARILAQLARPGAREGLRSIASVLSRANESLVPALGAVTNRGTSRIAIWGELDPIVPLDAARLEAFGGEHSIVSGAAHLPHIENPRAVNERIVRFLSALG